ncbi:MAG: BrnA antitoxin family protein [Boseongicola sp.]|nr:BrnA antitoxin family protein [Boseongicola sp.]
MTAAEREPLVGEDGEVREIAEGDMKHAFRLGRPPMPAHLRKRRVTMMLDPDIIERLKADGRGWQTRANALLREALEL